MCMYVYQGPAGEGAGGARRLPQEGGDRGAQGEKKPTYIYIYIYIYTHIIAYVCICIICIYIYIYIYICICTWRDR